MNLLIVLKILGVLLLCEAAALLPSVAVAVIYQEAAVYAFIKTIVIAAFLGFLLYSIKPQDKMIRYKEGFAIVSFGWIAASLIGALPFLFSGALTSPVDAFFETVSGFTTTGATVISNVEALPKCLLFWRSFTHWLGGMGILVLTLAISPALGLGTFQILKAESPGPISSKLTAKVSDTAKILYITYLVFTVVMILFLWLGGMPLFDTLCHTFGTLGTGGFSVKNASIGAYDNVYYEIVITVFMLLAGVNFSLYYLAFKKRSLAELWRDKELQVYLGIVAVYILVITFNLYGSVFSSFAESLRHAFFQVGSIISTTGYATTDFDLWPDLSRTLLLTLMFIGACAGSTAGGMKVIRIYLIFKYIQREIGTLIHPRLVKAVKVNDEIIPESVLSSVMSFSLLFLLVFITATLLLLTQNLDIVSAVSAVACTLGNIGPGLNALGPTKTFAPVSEMAKCLLSACMLLGRLELYTMISLLFPSFWRK
ncbi:MAG TPA: potassium transporter KefA [Firmicutes bacterium]|nr:TrkH family potassium uptake protein [Bacillota bacterium]HAA37694.1 potassium transporter KefA [Bacillota bacterium]